MNGEGATTSILETGPHPPSEDLMLYELHLLAAGEAQAVEAHLHGRASEAGGCAACRGELALLRTDLGLYALAHTPAVEAPAASRTRLLDRLNLADEGSASAVPPAVPLSLVPARNAEALPQEENEAEPQKHAARHAATPMGWWGWAIAAMLALLAFHFYTDRQTLRATLATQQAQVARFAAEQAQARAIVSALTDPRAQRVSLALTHGAQPPQPGGRATYLAAKGTLIFAASHLQPLPAGKTYELWLIPANGAAPMPAGTFRPDESGNATVVTAKLQPDIAAKAFGVTIEAAGGSATPTMPILLAGS